MASTGNDHHPGAAVDVSGLDFIEAGDLAAKLQSEDEKQKYIVVDVRDEVTGGHIVGARNAPSERFQDPAYVDQLVCDIKADPSQTVVFHCQLSQRRGPTAAKAFLAKLNDIPESQRPQVYVNS
jgi:rhodanese-related sulfurtransferase